MLTKETANKVYDILIKYAGASDHDYERRSFVHHQTKKDDVCREYRFKGKLGFGGKLIRRHYDTRMCVSCYLEDMTDAREKIIIETNKALNEL